MNVPEKIMNSIIMSMSTHIEPAALSILKDVLIKNLSHYTITECETLPATADDSNEYILKLFAATKATKLSAKTVSYYVDTIKRLLSVIQSPEIILAPIHNKHVILFKANRAEIFPTQLPICFIQWLYPQCGMLLCPTQCKNIQFF